MLQRFFKWIKGLFQKERPFKCQFVDDTPASLKPKIVYIIGIDEFYWQMVMLCPCGCQSSLHMNLMEEERPCWSFETGKQGLITIRPSINRMVGCKSHFFVRNGKIIWA